MPRTGFFLTQLAITLLKGRFRGLFSAGLLLPAMTAAAPPAQPHPPLPSKNFEITAEMIDFTYQTFDGQYILPCVHKIENAASQDWKVICRADDVRKEFAVHLWVKAYSRNTSPRLSYELLYWLTDRTQPRKREGTGATVWFHLNKPSNLVSIQASQSVEQDTAGLYMTLRVPNPAE